MRKQIQNPTFEKHFDDYENLIKSKEFKGSLKTYTTPIKEFLIWIERFGINSIRNITSKELTSYYEYLIVRPNQKHEGTLSSTSIKTHLFTLSLFLDHLLISEEIQKGFVIPRFRGNDRIPRNILTIDEIKLLYKHCENHMEQALLSICYGCGLRRSEMQDLNVSDINFQNGMLVVRSGKGNKRREVPMSDTVLQSLKIYVREYRGQFLGKTTESAFFLNKIGRRMSGECLNRTLKKIIERSQNQGIIDKEITLHCLRHSIAHHLMEKNAGIDFIKDFLGHSFINTAYLYTNKKNTKEKNRRILNHQ